LLFRDCKGTIFDVFLNYDAANSARQPFVPTAPPVIVK
jgi:hypothetical protein